MNIYITIDFGSRGNEISITRQMKKKEITSEEVCEVVKSMFESLEEANKPL